MIGKVGIHDLNKIVKTEVESHRRKKIEVVKIMLKTCPGEACCATYVCSNVQAPVAMQCKATEQCQYLRTCKLDFWQSYVTPVNQ
jgi:hypothetical protein